MLNILTVLASPKQPLTLASMVTHIGTVVPVGQFVNSVRMTGVLGSKVDPLTGSLQQANFRSSLFYHGEIIYVCIPPTYSLWWFNPGKFCHSSTALVNRVNLPACLSYFTLAS